MVRCQSSERSERFCCHEDGESRWVWEDDKSNEDFGPHDRVTDLATASFYRWISARSFSVDLHSAQACESFEKVIASIL
jgi:hypothetical protein